MSEREPNSWASALTSEDFRARMVVGPATILDAGLPLVLFTVVYSVNGQNLTGALWWALIAGAVLAVIRLIRRTPLQNVIAGFLGVALAAFFASRSGRAEDAFLPGFIINVSYGTAYLVSILVRWPVLGLLVEFALGRGTDWRKNPDLVRAYTKASLLWVGLFAARLAVQVPLYLAGTDYLGWLATARLTMSWPLFLLVVYLSWVIIKPAYHASRMAAEPDRERAQPDSEPAEPDSD